LREADIGRLGPAIDIRRIEEVDAGVQSLVHNLEADGLVRQLPEVHGAETQTTDLKSGTAKMFVLHFSISKARANNTCFFPSVILLTRRDQIPREHITDAAAF
jgi:hypothetical protein